MIVDLRKNRKPRIIAPAVILSIFIVLFIMVVCIGWIHHSLFDLHTIQHARSPDGRHVASILHQDWEGVEYLGLETSSSYDHRRGQLASWAEIFGLHPYGTERAEWFGYPDEHFDQGKLIWQDNHTLILLQNDYILIIPPATGSSGSEGPQHFWKAPWRDVNVIVK